MSRHRMKTVSYDDDFEDDDGYDSPDPEEQEFLEQCTKDVLGQLRSGEPSVTATRDEVQEALWHYYNDVEKSANYLRSQLFSYFHGFWGDANAGLIRQESKGGPEEAGSSRDGEAER